MELFCAFWVKIRSFEGETNVYGFNGAFSSIVERKNRSTYFMSLLMSFESIMDFANEIPTLLSLLAFIVLYLLDL